MNIIISNANNQPIYEQIYLQIKSAIISEKLKEGDVLPSIRNLAKDLRISVITTKRAYEELEREGFIVSLTGKGSFVAEKNQEFIREAHLKKIEEKFEEILDDAKLCGIDLDELMEILRLQYEMRTGGN